MYGRVRTRKAYLSVFIEAKLVAHQTGRFRLFGLLLHPVLDHPGREYAEHCRTAHRWRAPAPRGKQPTLLGDGAVVFEWRLFPRPHLGIAQHACCAWSGGRDAKPASGLGLGRRRVLDMLTVYDEQDRAKELDRTLAGNTCACHSGPVLDRVLGAGARTVWACWSLLGLLAFAGLTTLW